MLFHQRATQRIVIGTYSGSVVVRFDDKSTRVALSIHHALIDFRRRFDWNVTSPPCCDVVALTQR